MQSDLPWERGKSPGSKIPRPRSTKKLGDGGWNRSPDAVMMARSISRGRRGRAIRDGDRPDRSATTAKQGRGRPDRLPFPRSPGDRRGPGPSGGDRAVSRPEIPGEPPGAFGRLGDGPGVPQADVRGPDLPRPRARGRAALRRGPAGGRSGRSPTTRTRRAKSVFLDLRSHARGGTTAACSAWRSIPGSATPGRPNRGYFYVCVQLHRDRPTPGPDRPTYRPTDEQSPRPVHRPRRLRRGRPELGTRPDRPARREHLAQRRRDLLPPDDGFLYLSPGRRGGRLRQHPTDRQGPLLGRDPDRRRPPGWRRQPSPAETAEDREDGPLFHPQRQPVGRRPGRPGGILGDRACGARTG